MNQADAPTEPRRLNGKRRDAEQVARRTLGSSDEYAQARTAESEIRTARIRQIMEKEAGVLVERAQFEHVLAAAVTRARGAILGVPKEVQAAHPAVPPEVFADFERGLSAALEDLARTPWPGETVGDES
jgi:hypothetical protein